MAEQAHGAGSPRGSNSSSSISLEFHEAITLQLQLEELSRKKSAELLGNPKRGSVELPRNRTPVEELSFKLFDGQCLQYTDTCCDGLYDLWGDFGGVEQNTPVTRFPRLAQLEEIPYMEGDIREVVVFNRRTDPQLNQLMDRAVKLLDEGGLQESGATAMVEKLAQMACDHLGGPSPHKELLERYPLEAARVKMARNTVVMPIGEMRVGLSRHRALLLKVLADACQLPCRILRGDFYLGPAGLSGEHSVVMLQFDGHEWMAEMVTHPGRLFRVKSKSVPELTRAQLWGGQREEKEPRPLPKGRTTHASSFPTMPSQDVREGSEEEERSSSSGNKEGLQWSDDEPAPLEDLGNSNDGTTGSTRDKSSISSAEMRSLSTAASFDSYSDRKAEVARNVHDMNNRHTSEKSSNPASRTESMATDTMAEGFLPDGRRKSGESARKSGESVRRKSGESARKSGESARKSDDAMDSRRSSLSSPTHAPKGGVAVAPGGGLGVVAHPISEEGSSSDEWLPLHEMPSLTLSDEGREMQLENIQASIKPGKYGTNPWGGPARARVRGTDARGRTVEFEVEGLTVTHALNLQRATERAPEAHSMQSRKSEDNRKAGSLESLISRHRIVKPPSQDEHHHRNPSDAQHAEEQQRHDDTRFRLGSLALRQTPQPGEQPGSQSQSRRPGGAERKKRRSGGQSKPPGLSEAERPQGQGSVREHHSAESAAGPSGFGRTTSNPARPSQRREAAPGGTERSGGASEARQAFGMGRRSLSPKSAGARVASLLTRSSGNPQQAEGQARSSQDQDSVLISSSGAQTSSGSGPIPSGLGARSTNSSLGYADSGSDSQGPSSARDLARRQAARGAEGGGGGEVDLQQAYSQVERQLLSNPGGKEFRSSNSTLFDMLGMASSLKETDRTRLLQAIMKQQAPGTQLPPAGSAAGPSSIQGISDDSGEIPSLGGPSSILSDANEAEVDFAEVELGPRIGIGCFGEVFKARWRHTTVAVKRLFDQSLSEQSIKEFRQELQLNQRLKHPNVIMYMGACTTPPNLSIITQWAPKGSLFQLLHNPKPGAAPLTLRQKLRMALDIARGMHYLHSAKPPVIHRDLKSMNLLVDSDFSIKVCDFGLARIRSTTWMTGKSQGGTPEWTAPEVLRNLDYNEKSDVYSYGVVLYELATGKEPWEEMTPMQVVGAVGWAGNRLEPPPGCTPIFARLMLRCFSDKLQERPSFEEIIQELLGFAKETTKEGTRGGGEG